MSGLAVIPDHEVWQLLTWLSGRSRAWWMARGFRPSALGTMASLWPEGTQSFAHLLKRRAQGVPLAQLMGEWSFHGHRFFVNRHTLIPRADSEPMVEAAVRWALARMGGPTVPPLAGRFPVLSRDIRPIRVLDLGTGTGCLLISTLLALGAARGHGGADPKHSPTAEGIVGFGVDQSREALAVARSNAHWLGVGHCTHWLRGSWFDDGFWLGLSAAAPVPGPGFDLVLANPPYIATNDHHLAEGDLRFEPAAALSGLGPSLGHSGDGLADIRAILAGVLPLMSPGGRLFLEHGHLQQPAVLLLARDAGFSHRLMGQDLAGKSRWVELGGV